MSKTVVDTNFIKELIYTKELDEIKEILEQKNNEGVNWNNIDLLDILCMPENDMTPKKRRETGSSYTSIENIHKVIDPLFLNDLKEKLRCIQKIEEKEKRKNELIEFRENFGTLTFLDPACGSGNFLIETYISLRRLENEVLDALNQNIKEEECVTKLMEMYEELSEKESL